MSETTYTPDPGRQQYDDNTCTHCGCLRDVHHTDGCCYTADEMANRLRCWQATGRWPGPEEGCEA